MTKFNNWLILLIIFFTFCLRFYFSLGSFNADSYNNFAWMDSVEQYGWSGLYNRSMKGWAQVNYPPLTLYSFYIAEQTYELLPHAWQRINVRAAMYKIPSLLADILIVCLVWWFFPYSRRSKFFVMGLFLLNPGLFYNSVYWGQIESWVGWWIIATILALSKRQISLAIFLTTIALLCKQNAAPLILILGFCIWQNRLSIKQLILWAVFSLATFFLSYVPLMAKNSQLWFAFSTYWQSLSGQSHQHVATANALNFWYLVGLNNQSDAKWRIWGIVLFGIFIISFVLWLKKKKYDYSSQVWIFSTAVFFLTFTFMTRMHERHIYMSVAMLTLLLPYTKKLGRVLYVLLSFIAFYSLHIVWSELMTKPLITTNLWAIWIYFLAGLETLISILWPWFLMKPAASQEQSCNQRKTSNTLPKNLINKPDSIILK